MSSVEAVRRVLAVDAAGDGEKEGDQDTLGHWDRRLCGRKWRAGQYSRRVQSKRSPAWAVI